MKNKLLFLSTSMIAILASGCSGLHSLGKGDIDKKDEEEPIGEVTNYYYLTKKKSSLGSNLTVDYDLTNRKIVAHNNGYDTTYEFNTDWNVTKITRWIKEGVEENCYINVFEYNSDKLLKREAVYKGSNQSKIVEEMVYSYNKGYVSEYTYSCLSPFDGVFGPYRRCLYTYDKNYAHVYQEKFYTYSNGKEYEGYSYDFRLSDTTKDTYKVELWHDPKGWNSPFLERCYEYDKNVEKLVYFIDGEWNDDNDYNKYSYTPYGDTTLEIDGEVKNGKEVKEIELSFEYDSNYCIKSLKQYTYDDDGISKEEVCKINYTTDSQGVVSQRKSYNFDGSYEHYETINYEYIKLDKKLDVLFKDGYNAFYRSFYEDFRIEEGESWASKQYLYF